jgi:glutamate N-acetyltransferase/amino-acid N-acetyltransferase
VPRPAGLSRHLLPVAGLRIGTAMAGVRKANRRDLVVIELAPGASVAGVFTRNRFCAAPVQVCREHLAGQSAGIGVRAGRQHRQCQRRHRRTRPGARAPHLRRAAQLLGVAAGQVLPFSTGVIMEPLPVERITAGLAAAWPTGRRATGPIAAEGIMTTDTVPKAASRQVRDRRPRSRSPASPRAPA